MPPSQSDSAALLPVAVETIRCGEAFGFDLYTRGARGQATLYRGANYRLREDDLARLQERGVRTLYIYPASLHEYENYLREQVLTDPTLSPTARFCAVKEVNRSVFMSALHHNRVDSVVEVTGELSSELADIVCNEDCTMESLCGLLSHDYYTFTHVTNVAVYCLALAKTLGLTGTAELAEIAQGALLHDLGKRFVARQILNKEGKLSDEEFRIVKMHPLLGFRELSRRSDISWPQLMMVYQHHERLDGGGYPVGIGGEELHFHGRLCAVADVYDALSSYRPYRKPMPTGQIREHFRAYAGERYDPAIVEAWEATLATRGAAHAETSVAP